MVKYAFVNRQLLRRVDVQVLILATTTAVIRLVLAKLLPARVLSEDFHIWNIIAATLMRGGNPYVDTGVTSGLLFYPPLWMQVLFVLGHVSQQTHISLNHLIQVVLTAVDVAIVIVAYFFMRTLGVGSRAFWIALLGIALNPISIILTVIHGNFDPLIGLLVLATAYALVVWNRGGTQSTWLMACLTLGLGILAKTVPLVTAPLLLARWQKTDWTTRIIGAVLVVGPALLGVSVLYVLNPAATGADIFQYRSAAGVFGVSGILNLVAGPQAADAYRSVYPILALLVFIGASVAVARSQALTDLDIVLGSALLLMWIPPFGSGYGAQYTGWFLAICVVLYSIAPHRIRVSLLVFAVVIFFTYLVEYGFNPWQGAFMSLIAPHRTAVLGAQLASIQTFTLVRLPLFFAYLGFLVVGVQALFRTKRALSEPDFVEARVVLHPLRREHR